MLYYFEKTGKIYILSFFPVFFQTIFRIAQPSIQIITIDWVRWIRNFILYKAIDTGLKVHGKFRSIGGSRSFWPIFLWKKSSKNSIFRRNFKEKAKNENTIRKAFTFSTKSLETLFLIGLTVGFLVKFMERLKIVFSWLPPVFMMHHSNLTTNIFLVLQVPNWGWHSPKNL